MRVPGITNDTSIGGLIGLGACRAALTSPLKHGLGG
jgi:hypothetical protein